MTCDYVIPKISLTEYSKKWLKMAGIASLVSANV